MTKGTTVRMPATTTFTLSRTPLELRRRRVAVSSVTDLTPSYRRIGFTGPDLAGFTSLAADDHLRIFVPAPGEPLPEATTDGMPAGLQSREYTPVGWDGERSLTLDFVLHGEGVASRWAQAARVGDEVYLGGPRGSLVMAGAPQWWLLAGDLTALPAIRRHLATVAPGTPVDVLLVCDDPADEQELASPGDLTVSWLHSPAGSPPADPAVLLAALAAVPARSGDGFAFIAAEQSVVAPARSFLTARGVDLDRAVVKGYWKRGQAE